MLSVMQLSAQSKPDANKPSRDKYDTLVVFNPIANVPNWDQDIIHDFYDTMYRTSWYECPDRFGHYKKHPEADTVICKDVLNYADFFKNIYPYFGVKHKDSDWFKGYLIGSNTYEVEEFAQPWHLDTASYICGIYVNMYKPGGTEAPEYFKLMDTNFNVLTKAFQTAYPINGNIISENGDTLSKDGEKFYSYYFNRHDIKIKDFLLSADIAPEWHSFSGHTCRIYDPENEEFYRSVDLPYNEIVMGVVPKCCSVDVDRTPISGKDCLDLQPRYAHSAGLKDDPTGDTIKLYSAEESPWLKKDGQWKRFSEDTVYDIYQKMVLNFLPIILVPKAPKDTVRDTSSLADAMAEANLWIYPNPVKDILTIQSGFTIHQIDIFDISGKRVYSEKTSVNSVDIDASRFTAGTYSVRIETSRGTITRKLIKQS